MIPSLSSPHFSTGRPLILNSDSEITVSMPITNIGPGAAANVRVTDIILGTAARVSPPGFPVFLAASLPAHNFASVSPRFSASQLVVGGKYLITVRGTYETGSATYGFAVNRYILVPTPSPPPVASVRAHVGVSATREVWTYTIFNDEPQTSQQFIAAFSLDVVAPATVTRTPRGWVALTDNASYVLWYANDQQPPYPHHIAPGGSLGGFQIQSPRSGSESTAYIVTAWDHQANKAGLVFPDLVLSPSRTT